MISQFYGEFLGTLYLAKFLLNSIETKNMFCDSLYYFSWKLSRNSAEIAGSQRILQKIQENLRINNFLFEKHMNGKVETKNHALV